MFVESHVTLPLPISEALPQILRRLHETSGQQLPVGPARLPQRLAKLVRVHVGEPREVGRTTVIPLRWRATGPTARAYPALNARLGLTPSDDLTTVLSLVGTYTPPLGRLGSGLDRAAMSRVGQATADSFVHDLATRCEHSLT